MLIVLFFLATALGLLFNKSKLIRAFQYLIIFIVFVFNNWSQDDIYYRGIYAGYYGVSHEPGFDLVCQLCYRNGISYETFRMVFVSIAVVLLFVALNKAFEKSSNRAYSLILLYPLLPLVELLRNFMAIAIVACGIAWYFSLERDKLKDKIIFALIILLGASFHYNVLFFLILLLPTEKRPERSTYIEITIISLASTVVCNVPVFRKILALILASEKVLSWFAFGNRIGFGIIIVLAFHVVSFWTYDFIYRIYYHREGSELVEYQNLSIISKRMYSLNVYSFALIGLYTYNMEFFSRLYIFILLLNCFHVSTIVKRVRTKNIIILSWIQIIYHITMFIYFCQPFNQDGIMSFILRNNSLFP